MEWDLEFEKTMHMYSTITEGTFCCMNNAITLIIIIMLILLLSNNNYRQ